MTRLHIVVEGQTEEVFVRNVITPHWGLQDIYVDARRVETSRQKSRIFRGGLVSYQKVRKDLELWMKEDRNADAHFTTMFDLYALPHDFPDYDQAVKERDAYRKVEMLESAFSRDLVHPRFVPHLQLHEFEALLFCDPSQFDWEFIEHDKAIRELAQIASEFGNPELINDGNMSAPSKRIINLIPEYEGRKASAGPIIAEKIGLTSLREQCKHFDAWLRSLEQLSA